MLAVSWLRSLSVIFSDTSVEVPTFSWDVLMESSPGVGGEGWGSGNLAGPTDSAATGSHARHGEPGRAQAAFTP